MSIVTNPAEKSNKPSAYPDFSLLRILFMPDSKIEFAGLFY
jgi:hypothetical protein